MVGPARIPIHPQLQMKACPIYWAASNRFAWNKQITPSMMPDMLFPFCESRGGEESNHNICFVRSDNFVY